ncbi:hypothetical protein U1Q18_005798 [Sarracenia purpurea var. burkii]
MHMVSIIRKQRIEVNDQLLAHRIIWHLRFFLELSMAMLRTGGRWGSFYLNLSQDAHHLMLNIQRFLVHDQDQRLGAKGSSEVKAHPFFKGVNWDTLALQKAVFVPHPDSVNDTSYFVSRYTQFSAGVLPDPDGSYSSSDISDSSNSGVEKMDQCGDLEQFETTLDLSLMNFSFKNLSQLAAINQYVLLQSGKDPSKGSSPCP